VGLDSVGSVLTSYAVSDAEHSALTTIHRRLISGHSRPIMFGTDVAAFLPGDALVSERFGRQPTWQTRAREPSLTALLAWLLLLTFVMTPLVGEGVIGQLGAGVIWTVLGVLSVLVVSGNRVAVAVILTATAVGLGAAILGRPTVLSAVLARGSAAVALAALGAVIGRAAFGPGLVTWHRIQGAVALYVILGLLFAHLYGLLDALVPGAFANVPSGLSVHAVFYREHLLYFSFETLTTTGYGDIVPLHRVARSLATLEAVIGQLFPATLLARLVSLELEGRRLVR
jgi:ion channel